MISNLSNANWRQLIFTYQGFVSNEGKAMFLFKDALNTFYLRLYGIRHMVKGHSDSEKKPTVATWATLYD